MDTSKVVKAASAFLARSERMEHPDGKFDKARRWYPSETEHQECCRKIRYPSARFPYSLITHCRSAEHVAMLHGVETVDVRRAAFLLKKGNNADAVEHTMAASYAKKRLAGEGTSSKQATKIAAG